MSSVTVLDLAGAQGAPAGAALRTPPGVGRTLGVPGALGLEAACRRPVTIDCGDAVGDALTALRLGARSLAVTLPDHDPRRARLAAMAEASGAHIEFTSTDAAKEPAP